MRLQLKCERQYLFMYTVRNQDDGLKIFIMFMKQKVAFRQNLLHKHSIL